jgi:carboxypeptidase T
MKNHNTTQTKYSSSIHQTFFSHLMIGVAFASTLVAANYSNAHGAPSAQDIRDASSGEAQNWIHLRAKDKYQRSAIANLGVSIEFVKGEDVYSFANQEQIQGLKKLGVLVESVPALHPEDFPTEDARYHNYEELTQELQALSANNTDIMSLGSIGRSVEGREIWIVHLNNDLPNSKARPGIIYMGGHHAREHLSVELPMAYINFFINEYRKGNPRVTSLLQTRDIQIIPAVNPDGLEYDISTGNYKLWRKNRRRIDPRNFGVDLNRNYGFQWGTGGSSQNPGSDVFMGPKPFSEPETIAIRDHINANTHITTVLSFHTFSKLILYPWGHKYSGIENDRDRRVHETMARTMAKWNGYEPMQSSELYIASGDTTDWTYGEKKMISFTFELDPGNDGSYMGFYPGAAIIDEVIRKNLEPILYLAEKAGNPYQVIDSAAGL